jgi:hypothetical protein
MDPSIDPLKEHFTHTCMHIIYILTRKKSQRVDRRATEAEAEAEDEDERRKTKEERRNKEEGPTCKH